MRREHPTHHQREPLTPDPLGAAALALVVCGAWVALALAAWGLLTP